MTHSRPAGHIDMRCFHYDFRQKKDNVLFDMVHVSTSDIKVRHIGDNVQDLQKWFAYTDKDVVGTSH